MEPITFPTTMEVKRLNEQHPDYAAALSSWDHIDLLHDGGYRLQAVAEQFLTKRPKELSEVYEARLARFTYQNILGTVCGWYGAAMFETSPEILVRDEAEKEPSEEVQSWYDAFRMNCNRGGVSYESLFGEVFGDLLKFRVSYILTDLPARNEAPANRAEERKLGLLDPYLVRYDPRKVINWAEDQYGNLTSVVIATTETIQAFGVDTKTVDRWYYFDRGAFAVYEAFRKGKEPAKVAALVSSGKHALAGMNRLPIRRIEVPAKLWLGDRAKMPACSHLDLQNALHWGLHTGCLPVAVIKGRFKDDFNISEVAYLQLDADGSAEYLEPTGNTYTITREEVNGLREEIYRQMYLQAQSRSNDATAAAQSGISKETDMAPGRDVMNGYGDILRPAMEAVLSDVAAVRGEKLRFSVRGFDFTEDHSSDAITTATAAADLGIQSDTLEKEVHKSVARKLLRDATPETVSKVEAEIEAAPGKSERMAAEAKQLADGMKARMAASLPAQEDDTKEEQP